MMLNPFSGYPNIFKINIDVSETITFSDFDIKIIADKISSKLVKIVEQQLQGQPTA